jgi:hypothetical protein
MATLDLRFVTSRGVASDLIARGQLGCGFPTHVEVRLSDGRLLGAHLDGGVIIRPAGYDDDTLQAEHFVPLPCTDIQRDDALTFLDLQVGKHYDSVAIAALAAGAIAGVPRDWREPDSWFCSELDAAALEAAGIFKLPVGVNHVTPLMLYCAVAGRVGNVGVPRVLPGGVELFPAGVPSG